MTTKLTSIQEKQLDTNEELVPMKPIIRIGLFVLILACGVAVLMFGVNYYKLFPTNGNLIYSASLCTVFLAAALLLKRSQKLNQFWQIAYAFFIASTVNLISILFGIYEIGFLRIFGSSSNTNQGMVISKIFEVILVVTPIIVLTKVARLDLGSLFLNKGNLKLGLGVGLLVFFNFTTSVLMFFSMSYPNLTKLGDALLWGFVFSLANGFSEELWFRGLFMKKLWPLVGFWATVILTSIWFALLHLMSAPVMPAQAIPIFAVNTLTLGLACGYLTLKTKSIWGAVIIHIAADLFLFVATLAVH
jgi:membrane protease YdiL (CAAX protease family)